MDTNNQWDGFFNIKVDNTVREHLQTATTWARIVALTSFIGAGLGLIDILMETNYSGGLTAVMFFIGLIFAGITITIYIFLLRFANNTNTGINGMNQELFNIGIGNLRTFFKILGILLIIGLSLFALIFLVYMLGLSMR